MRLNRETERGIQKVEGEIHKETGVSSTRLRQIRMEVDALYYTTRGVLSIEYNDRWWRLVAFCSKSLNEIERNYKIHDKKMLAVIRGLENWIYLLESAKFKFKVWTDHKNLEYFMKAQNWQAY